MTVEDLGHEATELVSLANGEAKSLNKLAEMAVRQVPGCAAAHATRAADRRAQVGTGDRSERIRTYNFPQGRVSDHRINLTLYKIDRVMAGELDEFIDALTAQDQAERLAAES